MTLFCMLAALEVITGLFNSAYHLKPETKRIALSLLLTMAVHMVYQYAIGHSELRLPFDAGSAAGFFYCIHSAIKATRNFDAAGVPLPPILLEWLKKAEGLTGADKKALEEIQARQDLLGDFSK